MAEIYGTRAPGTTQRTNWAWIALAVLVVVALVIAFAVWRS
jgi:hypothetical protein